jgi:hypothetical protein
MHLAAHCTHLALFARRPLLGIGMRLVPRLPRHLLVLRVLLGHQVSALPPCWACSVLLGFSKPEERRRPLAAVHTGVAASGLRSPCISMHTRGAGWKKT